MIKFKLAGLAALVGALLIGAGVFALADEKPKYTIKEVMKKAHDKDVGILNKVKGGTASADEKKTLLELYTALSMNKPPKGEEAAWKEKTKTIVDAAKAVVDDKKDAAKDLAKATNCGACHKAFK
jgi:hypothetical protein